MTIPTADSKPRRKRSAASWTQDPAGVRRNILDVARAEFVENGLTGARVDEIAARTSSSKRMIYYYFGDKEGLYLAVLEECYAQIRGIEIEMDLATMAPEAALGALAGFTFDYHADHEDFVRLVMVENIHHAKHLKASEKIGALNTSAISKVAEIYDRGVASKAFRAGLRPIDIHLNMTALSFYNVSNRASIAQVFGHDMAAPGERAARRQVAIDTVLRFVAS